MPRKKPPPKDYINTDALRNFDKRSVNIEDLFHQTKKVLQEQMRRLREKMFSGDLSYNREEARDAKDLASAIQGLGSMFLRIEQKAVEASAAMTTDEKIQAVVDMIRNEGRVNQQRYLRALRELDYEISKAAPGTRGAPRDEPVPERQEPGDTG